VGAAIEHEEVAFGHDFASVIDVGAHHGQFALLASRCFPSAEVWCFEPLQEARTILEAVAGRDKLTIISAAAGEEAGEQELHVSRASDSSSLRPILESLTTAFPGTEEDRTVRVSVVRLDDVFEQPPQRPLLLKIDSQGSELDILAGGKALLRSVDAIFVECSFVEFYAGQALIGQVIAYLQDRSFVLSGVYSVVRDRAGRCLQADLLFERADRDARSDG
jgi:FkbM family methyltransferase